jgi:hypothetical protein
MNASSEFDLNAAIQRWRENLSQSPQFRAENLDELEAHLRDSISTMQGQRLTDEEVFLVATRRLGGVHALEPEFAKINAREVWLNRALWMLIGIQLVWIIRTVCGLTELAVTLGLRSAGFPFRSTGFGFHAVLLIIVQLMTVAGIVAALYWLVGRKPRYLSWLAQARGVGIVLVVSVMMVAAGSRIIPVAFMKGLSPQEMGAVGYAMMLSGIVLSIAQTIALPVFTVVLARKRLALGEVQSQGRL